MLSRDFCFARCLMPEQETIQRSLQKVEQMCYPQASDQIQESCQIDSNPGEQCDLGSRSAVPKGVRLAIYAQNNTWTQRNQLTDYNHQRGEHQLYMHRTKRITRNLLTIYKSQRGERQLSIKRTIHALRGINLQAITTREANISYLCTELYVHLDELTYAL